MLTKNKVYHGTIYGKNSVPSKRKKKLQKMQHIFQHFCKKFLKCKMAFFKH